MSYLSMCKEKEKQYTNFAKAKGSHINQYKISHCVGVAEYMRERADDYDVDGNIAYTIGLLHDIGYLEGRYKHEEIGYDILSAMEIPEWICKTIRNHSTELAKMPKEEITPMLVLLVEADLSVEVHGYRVGFEERFEDIRRRYSKKDDFHIESVKSNLEFIKKYQKEHNIPSQEKVLIKRVKRYHIIGKYIGSERRKRRYNRRGIVLLENISEVKEEKKEIKND